MLVRKSQLNWIVNKQLTIESTDGNDPSWQGRTLSEIFSSDYLKEFTPLEEQKSCKSPSSMKQLKKYLETNVR